MAERPISIDRLRLVSGSDETAILIGCSMEVDTKATQLTIFHRKGK